MPRIKAEYVGRSGPVTIDVDESLERCTDARITELADNGWCTTHDGIGQVVIDPDDAMDWLCTNRPHLVVQLTA